MEWKLIEEGYNFEEYQISKTVNGDKYNVIITVYRTLKVDKFWVAVSSGKKRKQELLFEDKEYKAKGGLKALFWVKQVILEFPKFYGNAYNKRQYIIIHWSDNRRRDIYKRLEKDGFRFTMEDGYKVLMKGVESFRAKRIKN